MIATRGDLNKGQDSMIWNGRSTIRVEFSEVGRPRQFDREQVLAAATRVFVEKGFEATSIQDLIDAMGINRASLYDTFGDKETLFLAILDRYDDVTYAELAAHLGAHASKLDGIRAWFYHVVDQGAILKDPGCLMLNSTVERAMRDEDCAARSSRNFRRSEEAYFAALFEAQQIGEIASDINLRAHARFLAGAIRGIRVTAKATSDYETLKDIADIALGILKK